MIWYLWYPSYIPYLPLFAIRTPRYIQLHTVIKIAWRLAWWQTGKAFPISIYQNESYCLSYHHACFLLDDWPIISVRPIPFFDYFWLILVDLSFHFRTGSCVVLDELEEAENNKNKKSSWDDSQARHVSWKDPVSSNELPPKNSASKLAIRQRDASPVTPRSTYHESSQQPDRKCLLLDRKSGSPSVLRKFGAMLQENEGKTLIEDGLVTTVFSTEPQRHTSTPICQSKFEAKWASTRVPVQKCLANCEVLVTELESSQESWAAGPSRHLLNGDRDSGRGGRTLEQYGLAYNLSPSQSHHKSKHHKVPPGPKVHKAGFQGEELLSDYQMVERILAAGTQNFSKIHTGLGVDKMKQGNDNLEQLLEMMEIENNRSQRATFTQQLDTKQVKRVFKCDLHTH